MSSKTWSQKLLSPRIILIGAPCLIGITAIAALLASMMTNRPWAPEAVTQAPQPLLPNVENSLQPSQPPPSVVAAQPIEPAIDATPIAEKPNPTLKGNLPAQQASDKLAKADPKPSPAQPAQASAPDSAKPSPPAQTKPSALTMQNFDPAGVADVPQVPLRVAVERDAQSFTVATSEAGIITDAQGKTLAKTTAQNSIGVSLQGSGVQVGSIQSQTPLWIRPQKPNGLVFVNGRWYRGFVQLIADQGSLLAVNHVEMQPYLYSVVGKEMFPSWPSEALKAQAIAARSYALVHIVRPASPYFDLGSTQRWQAYELSLIHI